MQFNVFHFLFLFFFNDTATTEIYTLTLHDALPICPLHPRPAVRRNPLLPSRPRLQGGRKLQLRFHRPARVAARSEEHTSELQSLAHLVCRLLLEKKTARMLLVERLHQYHLHTLERL